MPWVAVHTEFVMTAAEILDECVPGTDHSCRTEPFQATHRPQSCFEPSMIGLDGVIGVLLHDVACARQQLVEHPRIGGCSVGGHFAGLWTVLEGTGEEPAGGDQIPFLSDQHVDDLAKLVDRTVQIDPPSGDLDIVRSTRSALPVFLLVGFSGSPPEPDVPVGRASGSPQAPLGASVAHRCSLVWISRTRRSARYS